MKKHLSLILAAAMLTVLTSCGKEADSGSSAPESIAETTAAETTGIETTSADTSSLIAGEGETIEADPVGYEGMTPVYAEELNEGTYSIDVDSSSSMFKITDCQLDVKDGELLAKLTMSSTGYERLYMGTAAEAVLDSGINYVLHGEENGVHTFFVPVEALDKEIDCAAFSTRKQKWYDRKLVFRADSLPDEAFKEARYDTVESFGLSDGEYTVEVTLEGGSGKASVQSPAKLTVRDGIAYAEIIWSSNNYDYMVVDGERYEPLSVEENSVFEIPVKGFGYKMPVSADTTAMSTPHEIEYTLFFRLNTVL